MSGDVRSFLVPDLGEGLEDATVVCWHVAVGDVIELNQPLCSLETAKAEVEIPSPYAGRVAELCGDEGETLAVGSVLARIDTEPVGADQLSTDDLLNGTGAHGGNGSGNGNGGNGNGNGTSVLVGYGTDSSIDATRRRRPPSGRTGRPRAAPPVRKLAAELLVDLEALQPGTGPGGLITRSDVLAAAAGPVPQPQEAALGPGYEVIPVHRVHARMASRMALSRSEIPDSHASVQVECTSLLALRDRFRAAAGETSPNVTWFVLALRLLVVALTHNKIFNSTWVDTPNGPQVHAHRAVHLGFGVATPRGLVVPVVADAQGKTTMELASRVAELIRGAREGSLKPVELQGSTFTVSNFGALGLDEGVPVINHPEAAILGMGSLKSRAIVVDDELVVRPTITLTCAFDHRIADGAQVANFLCEIRDLMESPELALLDL